MIKDCTLDLSPEDSFYDERIVSIASRKAGVGRSHINGFRIIRKSIDARRRDIKINLLVRLYIDQEVEPELDDVHFPDVSKGKSVVVVGAGPAGLFASLTLIENGFRPIVVERGKSVHQRAKDCARLSVKGELDPESNYAFGEGGAGAFSDGKLYTRSVKRGNVKRILSLFVQHGADESILYEAHPHIGTDKLPSVIESIRNTIISCGGEVHFETKIVSLLHSQDKVIGARSESGEEFYGPVILATGHSAKDIYYMLEKDGYKLEAKDSAIGVRLEHPQEVIDSLQYHNPNGRGRFLPPASYSFVTQVDGRGVYSFCMCPGGSIVPAATEYGYQIVNGMSGSKRLGPKANAAMVVQITKDDIGSTGPFGMLEYIEAIERRCFIPGFKAPAQRMVDFVNRKESANLPSTTYRPGVVSASMDDMLPSIISNSLREGFKAFDRMAHGGFNTNDAMLLATETRTSSPVRIVRDEKMKQGEGLFLAGEGSGYAGGIVSAAIDGTEAALHLIGEYQDV